MADMPRQRTPFDSAELRRLREACGLSQNELADLAGVPRVTYVQYEWGRKGVSPLVLRRLAAALGVSPQQLAGIPEGEETLKDLRQCGGRFLNETAAHLLGKVPGPSAQACYVRLSAIEAGKEVPDWTTPDILTKLVGLLARYYGVRPHVLRTAWFRAFPHHAALLRPAETPASRREPGAKAAAAWKGLNPRQRAYLTAFYRADQAAEEEAGRARAAWEDPGPAAAWRKIPFTVKADPVFTGYTAVQEVLRAGGVHDAGAGASVHALARRGLVEVTEDQVEVFPIGFVPRILVELTREGRACARNGLDEQAHPARGDLLSKWLWKNLVLVAHAGPDGLADTEMWGKSRFYLGTGFRPRRGVLSRGFIESIPVTEGTGPDAFVKEYRWQLTDAGRRHIADHADTYRGLYPEVIAGVDEGAQG